MRRYKAIWRKDDGADNARNKNGSACNGRNVMREVRKAKCEMEVEIKQPTRSAGGTDTRLASSPRS